MAASVSVNNRNNSFRFARTVCLSEWWLIWADNDIHEKRLGIAGFTHLNQKALQVFSSAPILKRYDVFTLETTDGIYVMINGFMNKARTLENGFPSEVLNHFLFGFPPHWEACAEMFLGQLFASNDVSIEKVKCSNTANEGTNVKTCSSPANADPELIEDHSQEGSKKSNKAVRYINGDSSTTNIDCKKTAFAEKETGKIASTASAKKTDHKKTAPIVEETLENVCPTSASPKLNQDGTGTVCLIQECSMKKSNTAVGYLPSASGRKRTDDKKTASVEKETIEYVSPASAESKFDQDHALCMPRKNSMKFNKALQCVTSAGRAKNTDCNKTADVIEETGDIVSRASAAPKLDQDLTVCVTQEVSNKFSKAARSITRASGARNTDRKETEAFEKESTIKEKPIINEASTAQRKTKRKLTYVRGAIDVDNTASISVASIMDGRIGIQPVQGSPITPKEDEITSVVSPDSLSTKKSRSGRLLLPTLEYWRNERAVYNADHQVIGIKHGISMPSRVEVRDERKKARQGPRKSEESSIMKKEIKGSHGSSK